MSYVRKIEYRIIPDQSFKVIRKCATCNKKTRFHNSKRFRVNANGNKIDVWLIYNCEKCKHTLNLTIYERKTSSQIASKEVQRFLENDEELADEYGKSKGFFNNNKAEIDWEEVSYALQPRNNLSAYGNDELVQEEKEATFVKRIHVLNEYGLHLRADKVVSEILQISRSQQKKLIKEKKIFLTKEHGDLMIDIPFINKD